MSSGYHSDVCQNCQQLCKIGDPSLIRATGNLYHKDCFNCDDCQCSIINKFYALEMEEENSNENDDYKVEENEAKILLLCEKDYYQRCNFKCQHCSRMISSDDHKVVGAYKYHPQCLCCPGCTIIKNVPPITTMHQEQTEQVDYFDYNGHPYCRYHYSFIKGVECKGCAQAIFYQPIETKGQENEGKWHPECYMIQKYWQVQLKDLQPLHNTADLSSLNAIQLSTVQNESSHTRDTILKTLSKFEDNTSACISKLLAGNGGEVCNSQFAWQINILFSGLDRLYAFSIHHDINLPCDADIQSFSDEIISFLDILSNAPIESIEENMKLADKIARNFRDLVRFGLQQAFILERNFGEEVVIEHFVKTFLKNERKQKMDMICLEHNLRMIEMAITRFGSHGKGIIIKNKNKTFEFETSYKSSASAKVRPPLFPISQRMVNSTSNIHLMQQQQQQQQQQYQKSEIIENLKRSKSITQNNTTMTEQPTVLTYPTTAHIPTRSSSRMESIRRALTTTRKKEGKGVSLSATPSLKGHRDQRSYSLHSPSTPPLYISLPDLEKEHTPPLSPPSPNQQVWIIPSQLADITLQQDSIVRHVAVLYMEEYVDDNLVVDELLGLLESKKASSLWGKLKTHILAAQQQDGGLYSKKIGVSLSCLTMSNLQKSTTIHNNQHIQYIEKCKIMCPPIMGCFSENAQVPGFLRDCILAMIDKDLSTEGIFRKNGNIRGLKEMCETLDTQPDRENWIDFFKEQQIVQLAAFIKRFLRELPEPILTFKLHKLFLLSINNNNNDDDTITLIHYGICILPKVNRDILLLILGLLYWVSRHADDNKMNIDNLARVMAPNMLYSENAILKKQPTSSANIEASAGHGEIRVISLMIQHYERIVKVPSDFSILLQHPKMLDYINTNSIDLSSSKHFIRTYTHLMKVKKQVSSAPTLPPSPSLSTNYQ